MGSLQTKKNPPTDKVMRRMELERKELMVFLATQESPEETSMEKSHKTEGKLT